MVVVSPDDEIPRLLRTRRHGLRNAKGISRKHTANVDLVGGKVGEAVVAVARHQVPLGAEVMVHTGGKEVAALRSEDVGLNVGVVAYLSQNAASSQSNTSDHNLGTKRSGSS